MKTEMIRNVAPESIESAYFKAPHHDAIELSQQFLENRSRILEKFNLKESISISQFQLKNKGLYIGTSEITGPSHHFLGHGRSENAIVAAAKAFGESLERMLAFMIMPNLNAANINVAKVSIANGSLSFSLTTECEIPPKSLQTSNGWALHYSVKEVIDRALLEAIERTILQISFLSGGWNRFRPIDHIHLKDHTLTFLITRSPIVGFFGGIVECTLERYPGRTFGYFTLRENQEYRRDNFYNAIFEALEPALFFDSNPNYTPDKQNYIAQEQFRFAQNYHDFSIKTPRTLKEIDTFDLRVTVFDVGKWLDLDLPLYLAWSFGGNLIPLIVKQMLDLDGLTYLNKKLSYYGLEYGYEDIPII